MTLKKDSGSKKKRKGRDSIDSTTENIGREGAQIWCLENPALRHNSVANIVVALPGVVSHQ